MPTCLIEDRDFQMPKGGAIALFGENYVISPTMKTEVIAIALWSLWINEKELSAPEESNSRLRPHSERISKVLMHLRTDRVTFLIH
jgi:hypothetical protein